MKGHLTSITLNTGGTIWALGKLNPMCHGDGSFVTIVLQNSCIFQKF